MQNKVESYIEKHLNKQLASVKEENEDLNNLLNDMNSQNDKLHNDLYLAYKEMNDLEAQIRIKDKMLEHFEQTLSSCENALLKPSDADIELGKIYNKLGKMFVDEILSTKDYHKTPNNLEDKDLVHCWSDDSNMFGQTVRFYDAVNNCVFNLNGSRCGVTFSNYSVIPRDQWPQWAIDIHQLLQE